MPYAIDETHDPNLKSWVESANDPQSDFPIQNLPLCSVLGSVEDEPEAVSAHIGVRIGDMILVLDALVQHGLLEETEDDWWVFVEDIAESGQAVNLRKRLQRLLQEGNDELRDHP
ncbi:MAG: fumarylacetoacetase, partial [Phycisphaerales bacterium]